MYKQRERAWRRWLSVVMVYAIGMILMNWPPAAEAAIPLLDGEPAVAEPEFDARALLQAGGLIGALIVGLSMAMVALIVEHLLTIRRSRLMPDGMAEAVHECIGKQQFDEARQHCRDNPCFLGQTLTAGLSEIGLGYAAVEKAMEDTSFALTARLMRKIEYLSVIGNIAPMLGLMGTVWGMILAFLEFESKANPPVSELAPGIYKALVTTLMGLGVAVPALGAFAVFRNRIDELAAEATLTAEQVFADYKRAAARKKSERIRQRNA